MLKNSFCKKSEIGAKERAMQGHSKLPICLKGWHGKKTVIYYLSLSQ